jgi:hypothetical protein
MDNTKDIQFELESAFAEVFLTTRITQVESKMLDDLRGFFQTENQTATIRKQEAVRRTIRMAFEYMQILIAQMDNKLITFPPQPKQQPDPMPTEPPQIVIENNKKPYKPYDLDNYKSFETKYTERERANPQNVEKDVLEEHPKLKASVFGNGK